MEHKQYSEKEGSWRGTIKTNKPLLHNKKTENFALRKKNRNKEGRIHFFKKLYCPSFFFSMWRFSFHFFFSKKTNAETKKINKNR